MEIQKYWNKESLSRRKFLRITGSATAGAALTAACGGGEESKPLTTPRQPESTSVSGPRVEQTIDRAEITQSRLTLSMRSALTDFNRVLGLNIPDSTVLPKTHLVQTTDGFHKIARETNVNRDHPRFKLQLSPDTIAMKTPVDSLGGEEIYFNKQKIDAYLSQIPSSNLPPIQNEFLELTGLHEIVHFTAVDYLSQRIHDAAVRMTASDLSGKEVIPVRVDGGIIAAKIDGIVTTLYDNVEEAEAVLISDHVRQNSGKRLQVNFNQAEDRDLVVQVALLKQLMGRINPNTNEGVRLLQRLRMTVGGREIFCEMISNAYGQKGDPIQYALAIFNAINLGRPDYFSSLTQK